MNANMSNESQSPVSNAVSSWWPGQLMTNYAQQMTVRFLESVQVELNGPRPFDFQVRQSHVYMSLAKYVLGIDRFGLGDSYVNGDWDTDDLFGLLRRCCESPLLFSQGFHLVARLMHSGPLLFLNRQTRSLCRSAIAAHYDIGNDLFSAMLDPTLNYSCAYWARPDRSVDCNQLWLTKEGADASLSSAAATSKNRRYSNENPLYPFDIALVEQQIKAHRNPADDDHSIDRKGANGSLGSSKASSAVKLARSLHEAQLNKMLMIGRKLKLSPGMRVLDIGCGWGSLAKFLALHFDVHVLAVTISKQQIEYAEAHRDDFTGICCSRKECDCVVQLKGSVEYNLKDYRDVPGTFDRIVSVGMFEHVGARNYDCFLRLCRRLLHPQGILLLHTIGVNSPEVASVDPWLNTYIFPGGMLPRLPELIQKTDGVLVVEDLHNFGLDYCRTLLAWMANFDRAWPRLQSKYGDRFGRIWKFYLAISAAMFYTRRIHLWQIVLSPTGLKNGYIADR